MSENTTHIDNSAAEVQKDNGANLPSEAEGAAAQKEEAAKGLGKFSSVQALMDAYLNLEAEFTRRSQKLKELERSKADKTPSAAAPDEDTVLEAALASDRVKNAVVSEYLKSVAAGRSVPLIIEGEHLSAPANPPKSIKEAGALAKQFLKN